MTPIRAGIYLRVSDKRQLDNHSLDAQERLGREFIEREGWTLPGYGLYRDEAQRGGSSNRPEFQRMMADVVAGNLDVIIVYAIDRLSREDEAEKHFKTLAKHHVRVVSLSQYVDEGSAAGRMARRMFSVMATYYSEELGEKYRRGKKERVVKGRHNGDLPFGYRLDPVTKLAEVDPDDAEGVRMAFTEYATGHHSDLDIAVMLNSRGYRTANKKQRHPFSKDTVRDMLKKEFYLGRVSYKGESFPGQHSALIDQVLFDKCQAVRANRRAEQSDKANRLTRIYTLSGLLFCRECGVRHRGHHNSRQDKYYYNPAKLYGIKCSQRATIPVTEVENDLVEVLSENKIPPDWSRRLAQLLGDKAQALDDVVGKREWLTERLRRAKALYLSGDLTDNQYASEKIEITRNLTLLHPEVVADSDYARAAEALNNFGQLYHMADPLNKKKLFQTIFERVYLLGDELAALYPKGAFYSLMQLWAGGPDEIRVPMRRTYHFVYAIRIVNQPLHLASYQRPL